MSEVRRIATQLKLGYQGKAWHGPSLLENLEGVTEAIASQHPIAGAHSIWEIVNHIAAWEAEVARVLGGQEYRTLAGEEDWPPPAGSWESALAALDEAHRSLVEAVKQHSDADLDQAVPGREFTFYILLHGVIHHNLYHAGQIAMLRKAAA